MNHRDLLDAALVVSLLSVAWLAHVAGLLLESECGAAVCARCSAAVRRAGR